jgi:prolyl oligopeptidase
VQSGFADSTKIAITGGSNGGLVGAAVVNQHPGYFRAAILHVGVYDMIRSERFTVGGYNNVTEFGSVSDRRHFHNLLSYSPLHNIKANTQYPSMFIITAEFDDRVPPLHSYKYTAALQNQTQSRNPILLRVEKEEGHSLQTYHQRENQNKYIYSFLFKELGIKYHSH